MPEGMTVVFHDEKLYFHLEAEAAKRHMAVSDIVAEAAREWLENHEDAVDTTHAKRKRGKRPWYAGDKMEDAVLIRRVNDYFRATFWNG
ncbi:MAG: hypothetical protein V1932_08310 [Chloroflexota bacterium]